MIEISSSYFITSPYCLNAVTGKLIWTYLAGGSIESSPTISNGKIYFGSVDKKFYCLDAQTGQNLWTYQTNGELRASPAINEGKVYFGSYDKNFYCLNASTGQEIWRYTIGDIALRSDLWKYFSGINIRTVKPEFIFHK